MATIHDVCDYIIAKSGEGPSPFSHLKIQKLLYYCQAWHLAFFERRMFDGEFQAWVHGPVNRDVYDRFSGRGLYAPITTADIRESFAVDPGLTAPERTHVDSILEVYGGFAGTQLEELTHREEPWLRARGDLHPAVRSTQVIDEGVMRDYYRARLA